MSERKSPSKTPKKSNKPKKCTKRRYRDEIAAKWTLARIQHKDGSRRGKIEQRAYRCPYCGGWHLTSQKKR